MVNNNNIIIIIIIFYFRQEPIYIHTIQIKKHKYTHMLNIIGTCSKNKKIIINNMLRTMDCPNVTIMAKRLYYRGIRKLTFDYTVIYLKKDYLEFFCKDKTKDDDSKRN